MRKQINLLTTIIFLLLILSTYNYSFAKIIKDKDGNPDWKSQEAYRPSPIVFSHGFAGGEALLAWAEKNGQPQAQRVNMDKALDQYFNKYYCNTEPGSQKPIFALKDTTRYPYLELVSYIDFTKSKRSQLIDRNSSIDTYKEGDYYVWTKERKAGDPGWADKLKAAMDNVSENYVDKNGYPLKANVVCHSMGGLTAREYITNPKYGNSHDRVKDLVLIGVPNKGSPLASFAVGVNRSRLIGWFYPADGWVSTIFISGFDSLVSIFAKIEVEGDAAWDMDASDNGSGFLKVLNSRSQPGNIDYYAIYGIKGGIFRPAVGIGDDVVPKDSQLGTGVLTLKGQQEIKATHGEETRVVAKSTKTTQTEDKAVTITTQAYYLMQFIDSVKPLVEIREPKNGQEIKDNKVAVKGEVRREYLPADSILRIEARKVEDGKLADSKEGRLLYPSDLWVPSDKESVVAEFDEELGFTEPGKYKISSEVINPAGEKSEVKEVEVEVKFIKPVIKDEWPTATVGGKNWSIGAVVSSPAGIKIDTASIRLMVDGAQLSPLTTVALKQDGSEVKVSYVVAQGLSKGAHRVSVEAKDIEGVSADKKEWGIEVGRYLRIVVGRGAEGNYSISWNGIRADGQSASGEESGPGLVLTGGMECYFLEKEGGKLILVRSHEWYSGLEGVIKGNTVELNWIDREDTRDPGYNPKFLVNEASYIVRRAEYSWKLEIDKSNGNSLNGEYLYVGRREDCLYGEDCIYGFINLDLIELHKVWSCKYSGMVDGWIDYDVDLPEEKGWIHYDVDSSGEAGGTVNSLAKTRSRGYSIEPRDERFKHLWLEGIPLPRLAGE